MNFYQNNNIKESFGQFWETTTEFVHIKFSFSLFSFRSHTRDIVHLCWCNSYGPLQGLTSETTHQMLHVKAYIISTCFREYSLNKAKTMLTAQRGGSNMLNEEVDNDNVPVGWYCTRERLVHACRQWNVISLTMNVQTPQLEYWNTTHCDDLVALWAAA